MTFWKGFLETGATGDGDRRSSRRIVLCNQIALAIAAFTLAYNALYGFYELLLFLPAIILNFFFVAFYGLVLRLNARGRHRVAKGFLLGGGSLQIFLLVWLMSTDCGLQLYLFATPALAALLFSRSEKADLFGLPLFSVSLFVAAHMFFSGPTPPIDLPQSLLAWLYVSSAFGSASLIAGLLFFFHHRVEEAELRLEEEHLRSEKLLLNILPAPVAEKLKSDSSFIAESFTGVTVLFADLVGFTALSKSMSAGALVGLLNDIFSLFDEVAERHGLEKIKTIGDAYMLAGGLPVPKEDHAASVADAALDIRSELEGFNARSGNDLSLRIGIHSGPAVAGVIGRRKYSYDVWGQTINVASRMESQGIPGRIHVTSAVFEALEDRYLFTPRGKMELRGVGEVQSWFLEGRSSDGRPDASGPLSPRDDSPRPSGKTDASNF